MWGGTVGICEGRGDEGEGGICGGGDGAVYDALRQTILCNLIVCFLIFFIFFLSVSLSIYLSISSVLLLFLLRLLQVMLARRRRGQAEECVEMLTQGRAGLWNDLTCSERRPFLCQSPQGGSWGRGGDGVKEGR